MTVNDNDEYCRLMAAIRKGDAAGVEQAILNGVDVNHRGYHGETPLIEATAPYRPFPGAVGSQSLPGLTVKIIDLLLKAGAKVDAVDDNGYTALMYAVQLRGGNDKIALEIIDRLIEAGAYVNAKVKVG